MDEVDIGGEDYNELEARLYGQIHHEAADETTTEVVNKAIKTQSDSNAQAGGVERIVTARSVVNRPANASRVPDTRYWVRGLKPRSNNINQNKNTSNEENPTSNVTTLANVAGETINAVEGEKDDEIETPNNGVNQQIQSQQKDQKEEKINPENTCSTELLINPAALVKNAKPKQNKKKKTKTIQAHLPRSGPFQQQETKLQKALLVKAKKQKSKNVRDKNRNDILRANETIVLDSSTDDSDNSAAENIIDDDVVIIPTKPPPLITLSDSDNEHQDIKSGVLQLEEENAMDASDVVIENNKVKTNDFTKPTEVRSNVTTNDAMEKRVEPVPSRCTSPSSVLSSDDFIGQTDRFRLLADNCMADDQDLALLTADVDSLMHPPLVNQAKNTKKITTAQNTASDDVICTAEFIAPLTALNATTVTSNASVGEKQQDDYRVEQAEFRALDVYESESDVNDSVYSKGATGRETTIINAFGSSSEADDVQKTPTNQKLKRFSKRRTSSNNRSHKINSEDASTDDDAEDGVAKTSVPHIKRGTAVEHCNTNIRKRTQSLNSRRASAGGVGNATGTLSDTQFIATLNSLVQGHTTMADEEQNDEDDDDEEIDIYENEDTVQTDNGEVDEPPQSTIDHPVKLEPDEASLASVQLIERPTPAFLSEAVPDEAMAGLDKIFESIDNLAEKTNTKKSTNYDNASSDDEIEIIQPPVTTASEADSSKNKNNLPTRHIVYSERGLQQPGGIGWNDEMIKFYNFSWHGEHFTIVGVCNGMERDRNLWKINSEDRFPKKRPYSNLKCYNCCEFGHTRAKCMRPKKPLICYMCGESGHLEPRCPNTICLRCGSKTQVFTRSCNACTFQNRLICPICKVRGHAINLCPDKWRRYHSTTQPNAHPNSHIELNRRKLCCVCGGVGHFSDTCRSPARFMDYPVIVTQVKSHQKSYDDLLFKTPRIGIAFNLLYRPGEKVVFHMANKTQPNGYYGRFLKAVGLGNLLNRKRPSISIEETATPVKQAKSFRSHKQNPYGRIANEQSTGNLYERKEQESAPNQVQEVSGSVTEDEIVTQESAYADNDENYENRENDENEANESNENIMTDKDDNNGNQFKAPIEVTATTSASMQNKDNLTMDSDSNYSFSDHFEMPTAAAVDTGMENEVENVSLDDQPSTSAAAAAAANSMKSKERVREMEPLPDYIPLADNSDTNITDIVDNFDVQTGISRRFVAADTDDDENEIEVNNAAQEPESIPCEAKIYLTNFHSNYLLSPDGHNFLVSKSKECNIKARLDWTSVGHVLVIFGLPKQQDIFHKALLEKCHELMDQLNNKQFSAIKVPKRIDALIRFLRDNISQLQTDLGDVNDLQKLIQNLDKTYTKANMKLAEKCRRLLNMILVGQAGLCDGNKHLEKILISLKSLINDYQAENMVPQSLREEIDSHVKLIFTSYRHDNYPELIQTYNRLPKNQKHNLNIDPLLLGKKMLDTTFTPEQRARLEQPVATKALQQMVNQTTTYKKFTENYNAITNSPNPTKSKLFTKQNRTPHNPQATENPGALNNSIKAKFNSNTPIKRQNMAPPPFINPEQKSTVVTIFHENLQNQQYSTPNNMLTSNKSSSAGGGGGDGSGRVHMQQPYGAEKSAADTHGPSKGPSVFWSRESMRYLDECIQMAESNTELLQKLQRIQSKSLEGALSYNDYRAVIKLHGAMVGN